MLMRPSQQRSQGADLDPPLAVLLVASDRERLVQISKNLSDAGHRVCAVRSVDDAARALKAVSIDLAVVDLQLDGFDGLTFVGHLWQRDPDLPVLTVDGSNNPVRRQAALQSGVTAHLQWPTPASSLLLATQVAARQGKQRPFALARQVMMATSALNQLARSCSSADHYLGEALAVLVRHFEAERGSIFVNQPDAGGPLLRARAAHGIDPEWLCDLRSGHKVTGKVFESGLAQLILDEVSDQPGYESCQPIRDVSAGISVPMRRQHDIVGVINLSTTRRGQPYTPRDLETVEFLAAQLADGLEFAETLEEQGSLRRQLDNAERLTLAGELTAGITHEIKNPLAYVLTNLHTMREYLDEAMPLLQQARDMCGDPQVPSAVRERLSQGEIEDLISDGPDLVQESIQGIHRCQDIIRDLRTMMSSDEQTEREQVTLSDALEQALKLVNGRVRKVAKVARELGSDLTVSACEVQMVQLFVNLLNNAADAIAERAEQEPGHAGTITVRGQVEDDMICLSIEDNGVGMDATTLSRALHPLFTTKQQRGGTGLGMGMVRRIAQSHGGKLDIESQRGQGTRMIVRLPRAEDDSALGDDGDLPSGGVQA